MANLTIVLPNTHEIIPLSEVDLSQVTGQNIIDELIKNDVIPYEKGEYGYPKYNMIKDGYYIDKTECLSNVGIRSGDVLKLIAPACYC